jgi:hypothetical protein
MDVFRAEVRNFTHGYVLCNSGNAY